MVTYLSRDYVTQNTTTANRQTITSYLTSIFLRRILRYTYVGDTAFNINSVGNLLMATGDSTPTASTPTFGAGTRVGIANNGANIEINIPLVIRGVATADIGRILVLRSTLYPTRNTGTFLITALQQGNVTTIAAGSNGVSLPTGTINVVSTTGFPASGTIFIGSTTTIAATSNGVSLPTGTINVASTTGFPTTGSLFIPTTAGVQTVAYTGLTGTTFTGCTGGTGAMFTGGSVTKSVGIQTIAYTGTTGTSFTGCTGGTGTLATGEAIYNQNKYIIDYRGNGELAQVEANDTVDWYLYDRDLNCPAQGGTTNGGSGYRGFGSSTNPRVILQSPHATGYQVRICNENTTDAQTNIVCAFITCAPGFGGNSAGDFPVGGEHLHGPLYWDTSDQNFMCGNGFGDNAGVGPQYRVTMIGDDTGQFFHLFARRTVVSTTPPHFYFTFGIPDNEPVPLPIRDIRRLFVLGNCVTNNTGQTRLNEISLQVGSYTSGQVIQGTAFHFQPISCAPSVLAYLNPNSQGAGPGFDAQAGDSPFTSATELIPVDLVAGIVQNWGSSPTAVTLPYIPKTLGTVPFIRYGRANFAEFTLTTDTGSWTVSAATNASPIQITTNANNLVTGQTVAISGVLGNTAANGTWVVTVLNGTQFTLNGSTGNGTYTSGGTVLRGASFQHMRRGIYIPWNGPTVVP